ncbi:MAG: hypothetical protein IGS49_14880 [Chlorogloeopsis fritschii C42_A2020_084]|jgi:hypothetical protein|nr:hypothetical protein [Chlorogloeopsis fritschii]MBF2006709.1 hypothetical protein [Chlorogloeopsis fritschii C42_A2020_084]
MNTSSFAMNYVDLNRTLNIGKQAEIIFTQTNCCCDRMLLSVPVGYF